MGFFSSYVYDIVNVHIHGFKMHCLCLIFQEIGSWKFFIFYIYLVMEPLFNIINLNMKKGIHMFSLTHFLIKWVYIYCLMNLCLKKNIYDFQLGQFHMFWKLTIIYYAKN